MSLSIQEKKFKIDFQDGNCGGHLVFPIRMVLAIFDLQINSIHTKFQVNWPFSSGEEVKKRFEIRTILAIFDLHVTSIHTKSQVKWPFSSGEEVKKRFEMAAMAAFLDF